MEKLAILLQALYGIVSANIRIDEEEYAMFDILPEFRQGCMLSMMLLDFILDCILRQ